MKATPTRITASSASPHSRPRDGRTASSFDASRWRRFCSSSCRLRPSISARRLCSPFSVEDFIWYSRLLSGNSLVVIHGRFLLHQAIYNRHDEQCRNGGEHEPADYRAPQGCVLLATFSDS